VVVSVPDPRETWRPAALLRGQALRRSEQMMLLAVRAAITQYLEIVQDAVVHHDTTAIRAAADPAAVDPDELEPDLDAWPPVETWTTAVVAHVLPASADIWRDGWAAELPDEDVLVVLDDEVHLARHLADTTARLTGATWPDDVYEAVRDAITDAVADHQTLGELRERVADVFHLDKWEDRVEVVARTELLAAYNGGAYQAGIARQDAFGEQLHKRWLATDDTRTRPAHHRADGQVVASNEPFDVGGEALAYPHDPLGSPGNTIQCRCVVQWIDEDEVDAARDAYQRHLAAIDDEETPVTTTTSTVQAAASGSTSLPLAGDDVSWDASAAQKAVASWAEGDGKKLGQAFFWRDPDGDPTTLAAYKLPFATVQDGGLVAVPAGITAAAQRLGQADIPASDMDGVKSKIAAYYQKMDKTPPWEDSGGKGKQGKATTAAAKPADDPDDKKKPDSGEDDEDKDEPVTTGYFAGPVLPLDRRTGDVGLLGRMMGSQDEYRVTAHPWLSYQRSASSEHSGKVAVGRLEVIWVADAELDGKQVPHLWAGGSFDVDDPDVPEVVRKIGAGYAGTVSADLDDAQAEFRWVDDEGQAVDEPSEEDIDRLMAGEDIGARPVEYVHTWRLAGATFVQDPAYHTGWIRVTDTPPAELAGDAAVWSLDMNSIGPLVASAGPPVDTKLAVTATPGTMAWCEQLAATATSEPDPDLFTDPQLSGPTKGTVNSRGRVFGHVARWDSLHVVWDVPPPPCPYGGTYPRFHRHPVTLANGTTILTGPLSSGGHADDHPDVSLAAAQAHYDDPNHVLADVVAGEDQFGIWVSGALRPGVSPLQVQFAHRYSFSGDWRDKYLIAACSCMTPAYHLAHDDTVVAMVASAGPNRPRLASPTTRLRRYRDGGLAVLTASGIVDPARPDRLPSPRPETPTDGHQLYRQLRDAERLDRRLQRLRRHVLNPGMDEVAARVRAGRDW
jgi:hypothetical protein